MDNWTWVTVELILQQPVNLKVASSTNDRRKKGQRAKLVCVWDVCIFDKEHVTTERIK